MLLVLGAGDARADACRKPEALRRVVLQVQDRPTGEARGRYDSLANELRRMILTLRAELAPGDPDFAHLEQLELEYSETNVFMGLPRMEYHWRTERPDVLEVVVTNVRVEQQAGVSRVCYTHEAFVGPECGLMTCYFTDTTFAPPSAHEYLAKNYLRVLTYYALAIDATRAECQPKIVRRFLDAALRRIRDIEERDIEFSRMREIKHDVEARLASLR